MVDAPVMGHETPAKARLSGWRERLFGGRLAGNIAFWAAAAILLVFSAMALWPEAIAPYNPRLGRLADRHKPPGYVDATGGVHWLGTDHQGRDVLSRVIYGAQVSLTVGYSGVVIGALIGTTIGLLAGYRGGTFDQVAMRVVDAWLSFPYILIAIVWAVTIGSGVLNLVAILAVRGWVEFARVGRGQSLAIREREYITAVRALGGGDLRIMLRHLLPNIMAPILVVAGFQLGRLILLEATLSFLGLGVEPRTPAWGSMLSDARGYLNIAWWTATFPGIAIALVVLAANFMGDSLRDRFDPALHNNT
ncbi:MAG TPA: ABC transporter permease [Candidatus Tectomicrobia bacterium]|nr:ABC transporter permease [Candidatus Tectomicrobia bacterium]